MTMLLAACSEQATKASSDTKALQNLITIPANLKSAHWEMFGTPEYDGGVPGPTDYMTLIAEVEPLENAGHFTAGTKDKNVYIVPGAPRPWISDRFRPMLEQARNSNLRLATAPGCHDYSTSVKSSGRTVSGFACEQSGHVLLYLSLW
jgi:hypothetical protein